MLSLILTIVAFYLKAGFLFALIFVFHWVNQLDEQAVDTPISFRLIILPASMLFWPYLLYRVITKRIQYDCLTPEKAPVRVARNWNSLTCTYYRRLLTYPKVSCT